MSEHSDIAIGISDILFLNFLSSSVSSVGAPFSFSSSVAYTDNFASLTTSEFT